MLIAINFLYTIAFSFESLKETLPVMGKGMLGIFAVTLIIILSIFLLEKLSSKSSD